VQRSHLCLFFSPSDLDEFCDVFDFQITFAVIEEPSRKASESDDNADGGPSSLEKRGVRRRPGSLRAGETNNIRSEGYGCVKRYYLSR
jgi:hypothetical protein